MQPSPDRSIQEFQQAAEPASTPCNTSILFNNLSSPQTRMGEIETALQNFLHDYTLNRGALGTADKLSLLDMIKAAEQKISEMKIVMQSDILPERMQEAENIIARISHPEAKELGRDFLQRFREADCTTVIDPDITNAAQYTSYAYGNTVRGFLNTIGLNPSKIYDTHDLMISEVHEICHALQKHAAPALHLSPFNPETRTIVHPIDWIRMENLCERDAYAKQALMTYLMTEEFPELRDKTKRYVVSVDDFEAYLKTSPTLQYATVDVALNALNKPTRMGDYSFTFEDHYHKVALDNYMAGLSKHRTEGHDLTFVRLKPEDFYAIGDYGVGPNSLGQSNIDPTFLMPIQLNANHQHKLDVLCKSYSIPAYEDCKIYDNNTQWESANTYQATIHMATLSLVPA